MLFSFPFRSEIDRAAVLSLAGRMRRAVQALLGSPAIVFAFVIRVLAAGAAYLLFASVAHTASHADYGAFAIFFTVVSACSTVAPLGQQSLAFKYLPAMYLQRDRQLRPLLGRGLFVCGAGAICFALPTVLVILLSLGRSAVGLAIVSIPVVVVFTFCEYLFVVNRALGSVYTSIIGKELLWRLMFLIFLVAGVATRTAMDSCRLGVLLLLALVSSLLVLGYAIRTQLRGFPKNEFGEPPQVSAAEAGTYFGITAVNAALSHLDTLLMGITIFQSDVPVYFSALRITQTLQFFSYAYSTVKVPEISVAFHQRQFDKLTKLSRETSRRAGFLVCVAFVCVAGFSRELLGLFSPDFASGATVLCLLCVGPLVMTLGGLHNWIPALCGLEAEYLFGRVLILTAFFALKLIVIFGSTIESFALLSSAELSAITALGIILARRRLGIWIV